MKIVSRKKLWTALGEGDKIVGYAADNAQQEAGWIANEIARIHNEEGVAYRDIAIMYRANAQSRSLEEAMINANLPYQLVGGTKFYERREIKDALAYFAGHRESCGQCERSTYPQCAEARTGRSCGRTRCLVC